MHIFGKDCPLHCSEHPHWHHVRRLLGRSQAYPTQPQSVMDTNPPEQKEKLSPTVKSKNYENHFHSQASTKLKSPSIHHELVVSENLLILS